MATSLADLVRNQRAVNGRLTPAQGDGGSYEVALRRYWAGAMDEAMDVTSQLLAEDPDCEERFAAYRLWIEVLAETGQKSGLLELVDHLFMRGQAEPDDHETYAALRGLAHFELDQFGGAQLLAGSMTELVHNPYCLELVQLVHNRVTETVAVPALATATVPITDYLQWQTLLRGVLLTRDAEALDEVVGHLCEAYRGAPLPQLVEFHRYVESGFFAGAAIIAERLVEMYPDNVDFRYYNAYAQYEDGNYPAARRQLNDTLNKVGDTDFEIVGLLGHCNAKLGEPQKAAQYLRRAVSLLKEGGLPSSHVSLELANVEDEMRGEELDPALEMPRVTRMWLINLSARRYLELRTSSDNNVDRLLRPMGTEPQPGDFVFFASPSDDYKEPRWKIAAIYAVDSEPMWHPVSGHHTALKLVTRPSEAIAVAVQTTNDTRQRPVQKLPRSHPFSNGVFELELGALDIITEAVRQHREGSVERRADGVKRSERRADGGKSRKHTG